MKPYLIILSITLFGCSPSKPEDPFCRIDPNFIEEHQGPAACIVRIQDSLLVITHARTGGYDLPRGENKDNETAQCAAHRNTWNKTGLNVEVAQLLSLTAKGEWIFACNISGNFDGSDESIEVPAWADGEVAEINFIDPFVTRNNQWHFADDLIVARDGYVSLGHVPFSSDLEVSKQNAEQVERF